MVFLWCIVITVIISSISSEPVIRGINVGHEVKGKIINGNEFPSLVYVLISYTDKDDGLEYFASCGGILIKPKVVITVAHCLSICGDITSMMVWAGVSHLEVQENLGQRRYAKYYRVHKQFGNSEDPLSPTYLHNDIGLIWLHKHFELRDGVQLANLPKRPFLSTGDIGWSAGWGQTEEAFVSSILKKVMLKVIPKATCREDYPVNHFNGKNFCAKSLKEDSGLAFGDSGGPLIIRGIVAGMLSHGCTTTEVFSDGTEIKESDVSKPAMFLDIFKYKDWIDSNVNEITRKELAGTIRKTVGNIARYCRRNPLLIIRKTSRKKVQGSTPNLSPPRAI